MGGYVLVVDDQSSVRGLIMDVLMDMGLEGREACNGEQALQITHEQTPCAIVLDLMMPVMNGFMLLSKLNKAYPDKHIPVILLSSMADRNQMGNLPGVVGVMTKGSFSVDEFSRLLLSALDGPNSMLRN